MPKEKSISNAIIKAIHAKYPQSQVRKRLTTGSSSTTGWPDITGHISGIRIEIETKLPGEKPRKLQLSRIRKFNKYNCIAFWADSVESCMSQLKARLQGWSKPDI